MNETLILEKAAEAGFMINKDAVACLTASRLSENILPALFSNIDTSVFVIVPEHILPLLDDFEKQAADDGGNESVPAEFEFKYSFENNPVDVLEDVSEKTASIGEYNQFVQYFRDRYTRISEMIRSRVSARPIESISKGRYVKPLSKEGNSDITIIGMVSEKSTTNNQHIILVLEDPTGTFPVLINRSDTDLIEEAGKLILDEIVGVTGSISLDGTILMATKITQPDVPNTSVSGRRKTEGYALFISDIHVGSKEFMKPEWETFLDFLNGRTDNPQLQKIAAGVRYVIVAGDIVDGIGIYPGQEHDLEIKEKKKSRRIFP